MTKSMPADGRGRPSRAAIYRRFAEALRELSNYGGLPKPYEARNLWNDLWHLEAHHSTAIEGNTLVLREVERLLDQGRAVGAKEIKDYMEVLGYGVASQWVYEQAHSSSQWGHDGIVTITEVRQIHATAMSKVWEVAAHPDASATEGPGHFREHDIRAFAGGMVPPTHPLIASEMAAWVDTVNVFGASVIAGTIDIESVPEELARIHCEFERIHPFIDGNGRTGRLALNLILVRLGWPPAVITKDRRKRYLRALDLADNGDMGPLAELLSRSVIDNLHLLIPSIAGPAKYVPLEALVDNEFSLAALKQAATRGRLDAVIGSDGRYRSSRAAVEEYKASRYQQRR